MSELTRSQRRALVHREDLLAAVCELKMERGVTWAGLLASMGSYGMTGGGSSGDRRLIVEAMAALETDA